jgi:hypothetical protein
VRVKLSYTVEVENVLKEVSKLLSLQDDELRSVMRNHSGLQQDLSKPDVNVHVALARFEDLRASLLNIDTRAAELTEILKGYGEFQMSLYQDTEPTTEEIEEVPDDV